MTENPEPPPSGAWIDIKTGLPTDAFFRWIEAQTFNTTSRITDVGSVISGVSAKADAAQNSANAANQNVNDLASQVTPFSVACSPFNVSRGRTGAGGVTSPAMGLVITGGTGPFTYNWSIDSGDVININTPLASSTTFSTTVALGQGKYTIVRITVTDATLATATNTGSVALAELS